MFETRNSIVNKCKLINNKNLGGMVISRKAITSKIKNIREEITTIIKRAKIKNLQTKN